MANRSWTGAEVHRAHELYQSGFTLAQIGVMLGRSKNAVNCQFRAQRISSRKNIAWTSDRYDEIVRLIYQGQTNAGIARHFGVSTKAIENLLWRMRKGDLEHRFSLPLPARYDRNHRRHGIIGGIGGGADIQRCSVDHEHDERDRLGSSRNTERSADCLSGGSQ